MEKILITGGTGLIGKALTQLLLHKGYQVVILTRSKKPDEGKISYAVWNPKQSIIDKEAVATADHIIHLAGAGVADERWSAKRKKEIVDSRVESAKLLVTTLNEINNKVQTVVSASGIGWYGADAKASKHSFKESDPADRDFLGDTCRQWEESIEPVTTIGKRLVVFRTGIVLSTQGGAFVEFLKPMKAGIAGILSTGQQVVSWIHIDDICRMYLAAIENKNLYGVYNAVAPETVTNKQLILEIARQRNKPFLPVHVPKFVLKAMLGEMSVEVLKSATVDSSKISNTGFKFIYPSIESAVHELVS